MTHQYNSQINARSLVKWDIVEGFKRIEIWSTLAWGEISARYGRTIFGVFWNVISFAVFCVAIIVIFGAIPSAQAINFGPHVVVGFLIYSYIASLITDACGVRYPFSRSYANGAAKAVFRMVLRTLSVSFS